MAYHHFNNLCEMFQGHLNRVLMKNVELEDYDRDRPCNCPGRECPYGNVCRKALIVYKVTVPRTGMYFKVLHWCNVADVEKAGSRPSAECLPVPEKWN
jgi:hypothetical protein